MLASQEDSSTEVNGSREENDSIDVWLYKTDIIKNEVIRRKIGVAPVKDKMKKTTLRWFWLYSEEE